MTAAETPRTDERATLSEADCETLDQGIRNWEDRGGPLMNSMVPSVERILTDRLAAVTARAEAAEAKIARVEALVSDWEWSHSHLGIERGNWGPSSRSLRAALADEGDTDE